MQRLCLLFFSLLFLTSLLQAQPIFRGRAIEGMPSEAFDQAFLQYGLYHIETPGLNTFIKSADGPANFHLRLGNQYDWAITLISNEVRADNYLLTVQTEEGKEYPTRSETKTFKGQALLPQGGAVRLTVDEHFLYGFLEEGAETYYIEPAWLFDARYPEDYYVVYPASAAIHDPAWHCGADELTQEQSEPIRPAPSMERIVMNCYQVDVALAADFQLFNVFGSVSGAENFMLGVLNNVQSNYDNEFNNQIVFAVSAYFVSSCSNCDPWPATTNSGDLLDAFTSWGNSGGFGVSKDIASLWTNRDLFGDVIGVAWVGGLCSNLEYNVLQRFSTNADLLRVLQAHEFGHNFNASHDGSGTPFIMAPAVQNTSQWSSASVSTINNFIAARANQGGCFSNCGSAQPPVAAIQAPVVEACPGSFIPFLDVSENDPVSWSWTFPGGVPATSSLQNPVVYYPNPGLYTATLEVTNAGGSDFTVLNTDILIDNNGSKYLFYETFENGLGNWQVLNPDNSKGWETRAVGGAQYGKQAAFMDNFYYNSPGAVDAMVSPALDFTGQTGVVLQLDYAYRRYNPQRSDILKILVSTDGGATFPNQVFVGQENGGGNFSTAPDLTSPFTPVLATDWCYAGSFGADCLTVNLSAFAGQSNVKIRIENINDHGNGMYIDNVRISADCIPLLPPVPDFTSDVTTGCFPLEVNFQDLSLGLVDDWAWQFPGGLPSSSNDPFPTVIYNVPGAYNVILTVSNGGGSETITRNAYIIVEGLPEPDFFYDVTGLTVNADDFSMNANSVLWQFGDGSTSTDLSTAHTYATAGTYTLTLTASNDCGEASVSETIILEQPIQAAFSANAIQGCPGLSVTYSDETIGSPVSWQWTFEGGSPGASSAANPTVIYNQSGIYSTTLIVDNGAGTTDTIVQSNFIQIGDAPDSGFGISYSPGGTIATFNNTTTNGDSYFWDFGDGETSTVSSPAHEFPGDGVYAIMLIASNECGSDTTTQQLTIVTPPSAGFTANASSGCAPFTVQFTNAFSANTTRYFWTFEGGMPDTSILANPTATFSQPGSYTVTLVVSNAGGSDTTLQTITVGGPPLAAFAAANTLGQTNILLDNTSSNANTYSWDFGDGNSSSEAEPGHSYAADGVYTITLIANNPCGSDTTTQEVTITTPPAAGFTPNASSGCAPFTVQLTDQSTSNTTAWAWSAPGAMPETSSEQNPSFTFSSPGAYTIYLEASNAAGSSMDSVLVTVGGPPLAEFSAANTLGQTSILLDNTSSNANTYSWDFGDGNSSSEAEPGHSYAADGVYTITLIANNPCGSDTTTQEVTITTPPAAGFTPNASSGCAPFTVQLTDQSTSNTTAWAWSAPGAMPETSSEQNPSFTFSSPGAYTIYLEASNAAGSSMDSVLITVGGPPQAAFNYAVNGVSVQFTNTSIDSGTSFWDFGDGDSSTSTNPEHSYSGPGDYLVTLTAGNSCGEISTTDTVTISLSAPVANFTASNTQGCAPLTVQFTNQSVNGESFQWQFPGGTPATSTEENPLISYATPGNYSVTLVATNPAGNGALTKMELVKVEGLPEGSFDYVLDGLTASFTNSSQNADTYLWLFGNEASSTEEEPVHIFPGAGDFNVFLISSNACGQDTTEQVVSIIGEAPMPNISVNDSIGCVPFTVQYSGDFTGGEPESWSWSFPGGEPSVSTEQNPTVVYNEPGAYSADLTVTNAFGTNSAGWAGTIVVETAPTAAFTFIQQALTIDIDSVSTGNGWSYLWDFGDGSTSMEAMPTHTYAGNGLYTIKLTITNACSEAKTTQTVEIMTTGTIDESWLEALRVFPNPNRGQFTVVLEGPPAEKLELALLNVIGQRLLSLQDDFHTGFWQHTLDASNLPAGVYVLEVRAGTRRAYRKVVVE